MSGPRDETVTDEYIGVQTGGGQRRWWRRSPELVTLVGGIVGLLVVFVRHRTSEETFLIRRWSLTGADWLLLLAVVVLTAVALVPFVRRPRRAKRVVSRLAQRPGTVLAVGVAGVITAASGWVVIERYIARVAHDDGIFFHQPPVGLSAPTTRMVHCAGEVVSLGPRRDLCHGSWQFPLGTDARGQPMGEVLLAGSRPVVYAVVITLGLIVPLAVAVGITAGYYGGTIDDILMAYVDLQLSIPAMLVYLIAYIFIANSPFVFMIAFGLLSWGSLARLVRSETLKQREAGFVTAARATGASDLAVVRRHVLPNVSNSVIPAAFHLAAIVVLAEAGLSFLGFSAFEQSWGLTIGDAFSRSGPITASWWVATFPAAAIATTVISLKVAGDGLRDVVDPKGGTTNE